MMELIIASHHSGLIDCISAKGEDRFNRRMKKDSNLDEIKQNVDQSMILEADSIHKVAVDSLASLIMDIRSRSIDELSSQFRKGLLARFILSCLIDADHTDTANFNNGTILEKEGIDWEVIITRYYDHMSKFDGMDMINKIRLKISDCCHDASSCNRGIFSLSVPTGGGKTLSSLRFALEHLRNHNMDRIIYVIPYTSIIDQNAQVVRDAIERENENIVREYHSNVDAGDTGDDQENPWRHSSDPWDSPIIFTTMVQFMDTLFSSGTKCARRMHNLANSVIIFDEIQTLPIKLIYMFNEAINFLTGWCNSSVVLCTATQPLLSSELLKYPMGPTSKIIGDSEELFKSMKRVEVVKPDDTTWDANKIASLVSDKRRSGKSVLVITNTKSMAKDIHMNVVDLLGDDADTYHLSTNMCAAHRMKVLSEVRNSLSNGENTICISTQLIEAGVDVDFETVIRCMAGIDSVAQAAGRCNRNGKMSGLGEVYVI
ncbi:MAG: CRISPR-associated helicase Cas3', partial [Candidatus Methanoplasma sp.]|nr:CRISPR-associated helicase Cas3' [Candidatus Methanoplasma sp.]